MTVGEGDDPELLTLDQVDRRAGAEQERAAENADAAKLRATAS